MSIFLKIKKVWQKTLFHRLSLTGSSPSHLLWTPHDPWPGNITHGEQIVDGNIPVLKDTIPLTDLWTPEGATPELFAELHSFSWLRDLKTVGDNSSRKIARQLIQNWTKRNKEWLHASWRPEVLGRRLVIWVSLYDFFGSSAEDAFQKLFMRSLARQFRHLRKSYCFAESPLARFQALKGLVFGAATLTDDKKMLSKYVAELVAELPKQILPDGGHTSRSANTQLLFLRDLIDIRALLKLISYPVPKELQDSIGLMAPIIRLFRHGDGGLAQFGGQESPAPSVIDMVLSLADVRGRPPSRAISSGYERCVVKNSLLLVNTGSEVKTITGDGIGLLNFEWSLGRDRLILQADLVMADESGKFSPKPKIQSERVSHEGDILLDMEMESSSAGFMYSRQLYMAANSNDFRGKDSIISPESQICAIRFILNPAVKVEFHGKTKAVDIHLPGGKTWKLMSSGSDEVVVDSLELDSHKGEAPVVYLVKQAEAFEPAQLKWAFRQA